MLRRFLLRWLRLPEASDPNPRLNALQGGLDALRTRVDALSQHLDQLPGTADLRRFRTEHLEALAAFDDLSDKIASQLIRLGARKGRERRVLGVADDFELTDDGLENVRDAASWRAAQEKL